MAIGGIGTTGYTVGYETRRMERNTAGKNFAEEIEKTVNVDNIAACNKTFELQGGGAILSTIHVQTGESIGIYYDEEAGGNHMVAKVKGTDGSEKEIIDVVEPAGLVALVLNAPFLDAVGRKFEHGHYVMTTFYPYQWDLNYGNPRVFNEMMYNFLFLANQGMDVIRIDAVPYIWKELGTPCRNLKQVHTIVRMMRMIAEIVCPSVVLLGEVVMEPEKVVPYFGTVEKPECHMLYNVTTMATTWNSIATRDIRLLKKQMDIVNSLPKQYTFLNYLRCHDDIGWGLDFATLKEWGMDEPSHKRYLNNFFTGKHPGSDSRGELYNDDPVTQDARFCGTTASMCGIEAALFEKDDEKLKRGIREDLMLHAYMLTQSGIPMLYSSDEIGRLNDYSYKEDPDKAADSRYIHRGAFQWELAEKRNSKSSVEGQIFQTLSRMEQIRSQESVFDKDCDVYTYDVHDDSILCILRQKGNERFIGIFNFSDSEKTAWMQEEGTFRDLITDQTLELKDVELPAYGFMWCKRM